MTWRFNNSPDRQDFMGLPNDHTGAFIREHLPYAEAIAYQRGLDPRTILGQMALETDWGRSRMARSGTYNYGNIDEIRREMPAVWDTDKTANGTAYRAKRRIFSNVADHYRYKNGLYDQNLSGVVGKYDPAEYAQAMKASGYAADPAYADKIKQMHSSVARRLPNYQWQQTQPTLADETLAKLAGEVNSGNWGVDGASNHYANLNSFGKANFGVNDPRPLRR